MYAERTTIRSTHKSSGPSGAARAALRACIAELSASLTADPAEERAVLRARIFDAQRAMRDAGVDDGLMALVLRNMLVDLTKSPGRFDAGYFGQQLAGLLDRLS